MIGFLFSGLSFHGYVGESHGLVCKSLPHSGAQEKEVRCIVNRLIKPQCCRPATAAVYLIKQFPFSRVFSKLLVACVVDSSVSFQPSERSVGEARRAIFFLTPAVCRILTDQKQRPIPCFVYSPKKRYFTPKIFTSIATMHILWTKLLFKRLFYVQLFLSHRVFFSLIQRIIFIGSRHVTYYYYYYFLFIYLFIFLILFRTHKQLQYITFTIHYR